jgi:TRAP-type mannitol/chloroaromatic compound transport system substrate-binding protein
MWDEYTAANNSAMQALVETHGVNMRPLPEDVMLALKNASIDLMQEQSAADPMFKKVYKSYSDFQSNVMKYHQISEFEYYKNRAGYNQ